MIACLEAHFRDYLYSEFQIDRVNGSGDIGVQRWGIFYDIYLGVRQIIEYFFPNIKHGLYREVAYI